jgi:DNA-binding transcriptional ArsR family regulator
VDATHDTAHRLSQTAGALAEPARVRMLLSLMDGHARTSTELAVVASVSPSTASAHLARLLAARLVAVVDQGRHRYFRLADTHVADVVERLSLVATGDVPAFAATTPHRLRAARTCYDHLAGTLGVALDERLRALGWMKLEGASAYVVTARGEVGLGALGIDLAKAQASRRRFAFPCLDWSERRPHVGGALGAVLLSHALQHKWVLANRHDRALEITSAGRREYRARLGVVAP